MSIVFIATTGCAGSSLLMSILTELGMDTGYKLGEGPDSKLDEDPIYGGQYEMRLYGRRAEAIHKTGFPYIMKSGKICDTLEKRIERFDLQVDYVYGLSRGPSCEASIKDRILRHQPKEHWEKVLNNPVAIDKAKKEVQKIEKAFTALCISLGRLDIPHTMLTYPDYARNLPLTYKKLQFLMDKYSISYDRFKEVCDTRIDPKQLDKAEAFINDVPAT